MNRVPVFPVLLVCLIVVSLYLGLRRSEMVYGMLIRSYILITDSRSYDRRYQEAVSLYHEAEWKAFERSAHVLFYGWPNRRDIHRLLGASYLHSGREARGMRLITAALSYDASDTPFLELLLPAMRKKGQFPEIIALMNGYTIEIFRVNQEILYHYGYSLYRVGRFREALSVLALGRNLNLPVNYYRTMALCYEQRAEKVSGEERVSSLENAALYMEMAYAGDRMNAAIRADFSRILAKTGQYEKATRIISP